MIVSLWGNEKWGYKGGRDSDKKALDLWSRAFFLIMFWLMESDGFSSAGPADNAEAHRR